MGARNVTYKFSQHFKYSKKELLGLAFITLLFGFFLSFRSWGDTSINVSLGIINFILSLLIVALSMFIHISAKKLFAITFGFTLEHVIWNVKILGRRIHGLWASTIISILSNGYVPLFWSSSFAIETIKNYRIGKERKEVNLSFLAYTAIAGLSSTIILIALAYFIGRYTQGYFIEQLIRFNMFYLVYNLIPLPGLDGSFILYHGRSVYAGILTTIAGFILLSLAGYPSIIFAIALGGIGSILYYFFVEVHLK